MKDRQLHKARMLYISKRIFWGLVYTIFVLVLLGNSLLQTTFFQNFLANKTSEILTKQLGVEVHIEKMHISLMMDVTLEGVRMNDLHNNEMIVAQYLHFSIDGIDINRLKFALSKLRLDNAGFVLRKYENEDHYNISMVFPPSRDSAVFVFPATILCGDVALHHCFFNLQKDLAPHKANGFDHNHISLKINYLKANKILISDDEYSFNIKTLKASDYSGVAIENLTSYVKFLPDGWYFDDMNLKTPTSNLDMDLKFAYNTFDNMKDFIDSVTIISNIRPSVLDIKDIAYFSESLSKYPIITSVEGNVEGKINNLKVNDFKVAFANETELNTTAILQGITNPQTAFIKATIHHFKTTLKDIQSTPSIFGKVDIPKGIIDTLLLNAEFTGTVDHFETFFDLQASCGSIKSKLRMWKDIDFNDYQYYGTLLASDLHTTKAMGLDDSYNIKNIYLNFDGFGTNLNNAEVHLNSELCGISALGYEYDTLNINGKLKKQMFNGNINLEDPNIGLDFNGLVNLSDTILVFDFSASIKNAYIARLGFFPNRPKDARFSTDFFIKASGSNLNNLLGIVKINDAVLIENDSIYDFNDIRIGTFQQMSGERKVILRSDMVDVNIEGNFLSMEFGQVIDYLMSTHFPSYHTALQKNHLFSNETFKIEWDVSLKNISPLTRLFIPELNIPEGLYISGIINSKDSLFSITGQSPKIQYMDFLGENWYFYNHNTAHDPILQTGFKKLTFITSDEDSSANLSRNNFDIQLDFFRDTISYTLQWDHTATDTDSLHYSIQGISDLTKYPEMTFRFTDMNAYINDLSWQVAENNSIKIDSSGNTVFEHLYFFSDSSHFSLDGKKFANDSIGVSNVNLDIKNINLEFINLFLNNSDFYFRSVISGTANAELKENRLFFFSDLELENLKINDITFGNTTIKSEWEPDKQGIYLDVESTIVSRRGKVSHPLQIEGLVYPNAEKQNFDLSMKINNVRLSLLNPFIQDFVDETLGMISGEATLKGGFEAPIVKGFVELSNCEALIKYTNTLYRFDGTVDINENLINLHNIILEDTAGGKAYIEGGIRHKNFDNFQLDLVVKPENFIFLNTNRFQNDIFYGNAVVSGKIDITGATDDIDISAFVRTNKGTDMSIPISSAMSIDENSYIIFKSEDQDSTETNKMKSSIVGLNMTLRMNLTPEALVKIYLPGDVGNLSANGSGQITLGLDKRGNMSLKGTYTLDGGRFMFNLKNIISKRLNINKGSTIVFNGDPMDALLNVSAKYETKTTLSGLNIPLDSTVLQQRTLVNCIIYMKEELSDPKISFGVAFPGLSENITNIIFAQLDTTNEALMTQQAFSLLMMNSFTFNAGSEFSFGNTVTSSGFNMLTNQINNWLSQVSNKFDIGINYRPGDQVSADEIGLAFNTKLFNDRVTIDANVGYSGNANTSNKASSIVGDVSVEVKITKDGRFTTKVFSRSNSNDISKIGTSNEQGYTYGLGLNYRKNFNKFKEIFTRTPEEKHLQAIERKKRKEKRLEKKSTL